MKKTETIRVRVYASIHYGDQTVQEKDKIYYHAISFDENDEGSKIKIATENDYLLIGSPGIYGDDEGHICWADKKSNSLKDLAEEIKRGGDKHDLTSFYFFFDYPENFFIHYEKNLEEKEEGDSYWYGRPLTSQEREEFARALITICK